jgi:hypothetical protein
MINITIEFKYITTQLEDDNTGEYKYILCNISDIIAYCRAP